MLLLQVALWPSSSELLLALECADGMQGPVPAALGKQGWLESADLSNNLLSGPLDAFTSNIIDNSRLYRLNLAGNRLTGPVSGLRTLGVFEEILPGDSTLVGVGSQTSTHVLNISGNNFEGELPFQFYGAASVGGPARLPRLDVRACAQLCFYSAISTCIACLILRLSAQSRVAYSLLSERDTMHEHCACLMFCGP